MKRAERRHQEARIKTKMKKIIKQHGVKNHGMKNIDESEAGKLASVHGALCSCELCGNPRKYAKQKKTLQELKNDTKLREDLVDDTGIV